MISLAFHGAAQTVTGSKYLINAGDEALLVDCGQFQGLKELRERNWQHPDFDIADLRWIVLTHAHIDHIGLLPRFHKLGFRGQILCSPPTARLVDILLLDAAKLQEEDARYLNRKRLTKHAPAQPLFDVSDAKATLKLVQPVKLNTEHRISPHFAFTMRPVGHILGAASISFTVSENGESRRICFSGDVGRFGSQLLPDPVSPAECDYLVIESTYGDRRHEEVDPLERLAELVGHILESRGVMVIPAFAVGRAQEVVYLLHVLQDSGRIPPIPIHIDSPMALDATEIFYEFPDLHHSDITRFHSKDGGLFGRHITYHQSREDSIALNNMSGPRIIISSSGMLTGGRVLHHLIHRMGDPANMIALAGYQAEGTRGRDLVDGHRTLRIHGRDHEVQAEVVEIGGLSGHADYAELLRWLEPMQGTPRRTFVTHGELGPAMALAATLHSERGFDALPPAIGDQFEL